MKLETIILTSLTLLSLKSFAQDISKTNEGSCDEVSIEVPVAKDAQFGYHDNYNPGNTNAGGLDYFSIFTIDGTSGGVNQVRTTIEFDLSQIPSNATITSAKLSLFGYGPAAALSGHTGTANEVSLHRITQSWTEYGVTYLTQPTFESTYTYQLPASTSSTQDYVNFDITNLILDIVNSGSNNGFLLKLTNESPNNSMIFCSREHSDAAKHPKLLVTYEVPNSLSLFPSKDAQFGYHDNYNPGNTNAGGLDYFSIFTIDGTSGGVNQVRTAMEFDLSQIPANATVLSAKLNLFGYGPAAALSGHTGTANEVSLHRITQAWDELTITYLTQPTFESTFTYQLPASTSSTQDYTNFDITNLILDIINSGSNNGFMLKLTNESPNNSMIFCSRENATISKRPYLEIILDCGDETSGISELKTNSSLYSINAYPNPSHGLINFDMSSITDRNKESLTLIFYNTFGQIIHSQKITSDFESVNLNNISSSGIIYYNVVDNNDIVYSAGKVVLIN